MTKVKREHEGYWKLQVACARAPGNISLLYGKDKVDGPRNGYVLFTKNIGSDTA